MKSSMVFIIATASTLAFGLEVAAQPKMHDEASAVKHNMTGYVIGDTATFAMNFDVALFEGFESPLEQIQIQIRADLSDFGRGMALYASAQAMQESAPCGDRYSIDVSGYHFRPLNDAAQLTFPTTYERWFCAEVQVPDLSSWPVKWKVEKTVMSSIFTARGASEFVFLPNLSDSGISLGTAITSERPSASSEIANFTEGLSLGELVLTFSDEVTRDRRAGPVVQLSEDVTIEGIRFYQAQFEQDMEGALTLVAQGSAELTPEVEEWIRKSVQ